MKKFITKLFHQAGIEINGSHPWDIQVLDERFYPRVFKDASLGLGESYVDGWWECKQIDEMIARLLKADLDKRASLSPRDWLSYLLHSLFNYQTKYHSTEVAEKHYNIGNELYQKMLGSTLNYSCGYWKLADNLDAAQRDKMELICQKLMLQPGQRLLDIGCGWGSLAKYAAEHYQVEVTGITISQPQKEYAEEICKGLPVKILLQDYRDLPPQSFDSIVSVGMFEHVGNKNYRNFMEVASERLSEKGTFLLHTIGSNVSYSYGDVWINKYIFPHGMLPSIAQIGSAIENLFVMEDWHNFGIYYNRTLLEWHKRFNASWPEINAHYDERFHRMWNYYLLSCAGAFRARKIQLWQIVLTKSGLPDGFNHRDLSRQASKMLPETTNVIQTQAKAYTTNAV